MKKLVVLVSFLLLSLHAFAQSAANDIKEITAMILTQQKQTNETMVDARVFSSQGYYSFYSTGGLLNFNPNDTSFASNKEIRKMLNEQVVAKFENDEIDDIELLIIEQGE